MIKIGLFGIGLDTYWPQFEGLLDKLQAYQSQIKQQIQSDQVEVIDAGMVDNTAKAHKTASLFRQQEVDLLFLYVSTYALSSTVLPVVQKVKVPVIILNLQPVPQLDYQAFNQLKDRGKMTGVWLEHCQACSVPELAAVFNRASVQYDIITGYLEDNEAWEEIHSWTQAAHVVGKIKNSRIGILGHYYNGMLDVYTDVTRQAITFGTHYELLEMCALQRNFEEADDQALNNKIKEFREVFDVTQECEPSELKRAAQTSWALDRLVEQNQLDALAYYYEGQPGNEYENLVTSVIPGNTLLTGKGIPVAGECEVKNALAMKILSELGAGGSFSEFYLMDFKDGVVYLGHDGPAHPIIAEDQVKLVPLPVYHGKPGKGLSIEMQVKNGPVTLLSVVESANEVFLLVAEGESVPGPILEIGNTNSRYKFPLSPREFIKQWSMQGPAHHCAIGLGHQASTIEKIGQLFDINTVKIC